MEGTLFLKKRILLAAGFFLAGIISCGLPPGGLKPVSLEDSRFNGKFVHTYTQRTPLPMEEVQSSYLFDGTNRASFYKETKYSHDGSSWWNEDPPYTHEYQIILEEGVLYIISWDRPNEEWHRQGEYSFDEDGNLLIGSTKYEKEDLAVSG